MNVDGDVLNEPCDFIELGNVPSHNKVMFEHHKPMAFTEPYHHHASIELNYLEDCSMVYSFSGKKVTLLDRRLTVFWAVKPHKVVSVAGEGSITNAYISLSQFLQWRLPKNFTDAILSGHVVSTRAFTDIDKVLIKQWQIEHTQQSHTWNALHALEIQCRLKRIALEGWDSLLTPSHPELANTKGGRAIYHIEKMLKYISDNFVGNISSQDIASQAGISKSYAISLFHNMLGMSIKQYLVDLRLVHAKMRLRETNDKILTVALESGFGSLSSFYATFYKHMGVSPARFRKN